MKSLLLLSMVCSVFFLQAQQTTVPYKVVFDLTSGDTNAHRSVVRWLNGISQERPDAQMEVVLYGQSLNMITKGKSTVAADLEQLLQNKNITVKACGVALKHHNIDPSALLPGVAIVPDGIYEIISRQKEGWGYIKAAQ